MKKKQNPWAQIIFTMEKAGHRPVDIAHIFQCHPQNVQDLKRGQSKAPKGMMAVRMYLHAKAAGMELPG